MKLQRNKERKNLKSYKQTWKQNIYQIYIKQKNKNLKVTGEKKTQKKILE